jgi:hypothetical protein
MTTFNKFDKTTLTNLRNEMNALLAKYGTESNLEISVGNMRFSEAEVEIKVKAKVKGAKTRSNMMLEARVASLGLKMKNSVGDQLVDYNSRAYKMPFVYIKASDGKRYKCGAPIARALFGK